MAHWYSVTEYSQRDEWGTRASREPTVVSKTEERLEFEHGGLTFQVQIHKVEIHEDDIIRGDRWRFPPTKAQRASAMADFLAIHGAPLSEK